MPLLQAPPIVSAPLITRRPYPSRTVPLSITPPASRTPRTPAQPRSAPTASVMERMKPADKHVSAPKSASDYMTYIRTLKCENARGAVEAVRGGKMPFPTSVAWNSTGTHLAAGFNDNFVRVWSIRALEKGEIPVVLPGHTDSVDQVIFHPTDSQRIATASLDKTVRVWDVRSAKCLHTILTEGQNINMNWSPDGAFICVGNKEDSLTFIDTHTWKIVDTVKFAYEVNELAWDRECKRLLLAHGQHSAGGIQVLECTSKESIASVRGHMSACTTLDVSPDGRYIASGGTDALVCLWDADELSCVRSWGALEWPIRSLAFSHDSQLLAAVSEDNFLIICHIETGQIIRKVNHELGGMHSVAWHPNRLVLAFAGDKSRGETRRLADAVGVRILGL